MTFQSIVVLAAMTAAVQSSRVDEKRQAPPPTLTVEASPGTVVRWSVPGTKRCTMGRRTWDAIQETCYYPIDILEPARVIRVSRQGVGRPASARIYLQPVTPVREDITLGDIPQAKPSSLDRERNTREQMRILKLWRRREGPARFTLPLTPPAKGLPDGKGFGATWVFNLPPNTSDLHSGADYPLPAGTPLAAAADGVVIMAEDLFYAGNAVFIDHGDGLVTMYFHLRDIKVRNGQEVRRGETIGTVGSTGRVTGPHLHLGMRWHEARIDPALLFGDPARMPAIGQ